MRVQVIHCHPLVESYNHALFAIIVATLAKNGHEAIATDLYREHFDPTMIGEERASYYAQHYAGTAVSVYAEKLRQVDAVIFCFPQWWFSLPAMLKGYFDRVWAPGVAFTHDLTGGRIKPLLTNIRWFGVVTSYGSPWWVTQLAGDPGRKVLMRGMKPMCGPAVRSFYLAHYDMDRSTLASRQSFIARIRAQISRL